MGAHVRYVPHESPASTGTQDIVASGLTQTPKAVVTFSSYADDPNNTSGNYAHAACLAVPTGFSYLCELSGNNNQSTSEQYRKYRRQSAVPLLPRLAFNAIHQNTGALRYQAKLDSAIAGGIRVDWTTVPNNARSCGALMFFDDHPDAEFLIQEVTTPTTQDGTLNLTGLSGPADFAWIVYNMPGVATSGQLLENGILGLGCWINGGPQRGAALFAEHNQSIETNVIGYLGATRVAAAMSSSPVLGSTLEFSSHANGLTMTLRDAAGGLGPVAVLMGRWGSPGVQMDLPLYDVPILAGTDATTGVGFRPHTVFFVHTHMPTSDAKHNNNAGGTLGFGAHDSAAATDSATAFSDEQGLVLALGNTDCHTAYTTAACSLGIEPDTQDRQIGAVQSMDADGFTLDWQSAPIDTAGIGWAFAFSSPVEGLVEQMDEFTIFSTPEGVPEYLGLIEFMLGQTLFSTPLGVPIIPGFVEFMLGQTVFSTPEGVVGDPEVGVEFMLNATVFNTPMGEVDTGVDVAFMVNATVFTTPRGVVGHVGRVAPMENRTAFGKVRPDHVRTSPPTGTWPGLMQASHAESRRGQASHAAVLYAETSWPRVGRTEESHG